MRVTYLFNHQMHVEKSQDVQTSKDNGEPEIVDAWELIFTDRGSGDQVRIKFGRDARDSIVKQLTGGVVLAGGEFPKV